MQKASHLESSLLLTQLESRLEKNPYLSRDALPAWEDARVLLAIEHLKKTPNRQTHPALYHWYVIMKQFAPRTIQAWSEGEDGREGKGEDALITQFVQQAKGALGGRVRERELPSQPVRASGAQGNWRSIVTSPKNTKRRMSQNYVEFNENINLSQKDIPHSPFPASPAHPDHRLSFNLLAHNNEHEFLSGEQEYTMEIQLSAERPGWADELQGRLSSERVSVLSVAGEEGSVQMVFRAGGEACEALKDRISQWPEVANIRFRRHRKPQPPQIKSERTLFSPIRKIHNRP